MLAQTRGGHGGADPLARVRSDEVVGAHEPFESFVIDRVPSSAQLGMHPWRAIGGPRISMYRADLAEKLSFDPLGLRRSSISLAAPLVIRRGRHPGGSADGRYREPVGLLGVDTAVAGHSVDSLTQKAHELV